MPRGYKGVHTYYGAHGHVKHMRGSASGYTCACGSQAREWSYDGLDPNEQVDKNGRFSADANHYTPRCGHCHRHLDIGGMKNHMAFMDDDLVAIVVAEYKAGATTLKLLSEKYGISIATVSAWVNKTRRHGP